ncbi:MAG: HAD family hydrolase [Oscillospiraceae bacterium]
MRAFRKLLDKLRKSGVQVAIVSNKPDPTTKALAEKFFPGVPAFGQRDDLPPKPAPDLVLCALKELGCPRESAIYVGDSEVDIQTAWNCRMNYIGVSWGFRGREKLLAVAPRAIVVDRAEEILQGKNLQLVH